MEKLSEFLRQFNISQSDFNSTGLNWQELLVLKADYEKFMQELKAPANYLIETFHCNVEEIHSVRFRIKDSNHLIEKIIRKKIENPERIIDTTNYRDEITDLIGLRALHLFKEDWIKIHDFIKRTWDLHEDPIAYYRSGDTPEYIEVFQKYGCQVKEHPHGYRSVHYLVETSPNKKTYIAEVQVRTIFEEGWSEIDHRIRYPYNKDNKLLGQFLFMFNRLSGNADEMGSYIQILKIELENNVKTINDLKKKIETLEPKDILQWRKQVDEAFNVVEFQNILFPPLSTDLIISPNSLIWGERIATKSQQETKKDTNYKSTKIKDKTMITESTPKVENAPSKTGRKSGRKRGNNPPKEKLEQTTKPIPKEIIKPNTKETTRLIPKETTKQKTKSPIKQNDQAPKKQKPTSPKKK